MISIPIALRTALIAGALICAFSMLREIRKKKVQIEYTLFWLLFSGLLIILAVFPYLIYVIAKPLGIISPANLVFALIILILIVKSFLMTLQISEMDMKIRKLTQYLAIREEEENEKKMQSQGAEKQIPEKETNKTEIL
jgi:hypothetical protein